MEAFIDKRGRIVLDKLHDTERFALNVLFGHNREPQNKKQNTDVLCNVVQEGRLVKYYLTFSPVKLAHKKPKGKK